MLTITVWWPCNMVLPMKAWWFAMRSWVFIQSVDVGTSDLELGPLEERNLPPGKWFSNPPTCPTTAGVVASPF